MATPTVVLLFVLVALHSILASGAPLYARRLLQRHGVNYQAFQNTIWESARQTVRHSSDLDSHEAVAATVIADIHNLKDPGLNDRPGNAFGVEFSGLVWSSVVPASHERFVEQGSVSNDQELAHANLGYLATSNGMMPYLACPSGQVIKTSPRAKAGEFGWPCRDGGAIAFTNAQVGRSCMVFMRARDLYHTHQPGFSAVEGNFKSAIEVCKPNPPSHGRSRRLPPVKVDLTILAKCIMLTFTHPPGRSEVATLKGLAVLPARTEADLHANRPQLYGITAPFGHLLLESIEIPLSFELPNLNINPLILLCVAAFS